MKLETWKLFTAIIIPTLGWIIGYLLKQRNDFKNAKRNKRIDFLIGTYLKLENCIHRKSNSCGSELENAFAEIQLMGNINQITLANKISREIAEDGSADLETLLESLRNDLRNELKLGEVKDKIQFFRLKNYA